MSPRLRAIQRARSRTNRALTLPPPPLPLKRASQNSSLENSDGFERHNFNAVVSNYGLATTYFPAFRQSVVRGGAQGVMCSYNALNGVPTCASPFLRDVLRGEWGFSGYITSDT